MENGRRLPGKDIEEAYALQAGREVRIIVRPENLDDLASVGLARDVARKIEEGKRKSSLDR